MSYTPEMLRKIAAGIGTLTPGERIALLADEWALVRAGRHDAGSYMDLASAFGGERSAEVMGTLTGTLGAIGEELTTGESRRAYRDWLSSLLQPVLQEVGYAGTAAEADDRKALRAAVVRVLGRTARDPAVLRKARELVLSELATSGTVESTLLNVVVGLAAIQGDPALYEKYMERSRTAGDPEEKYRYLHALAAFSDPTFVTRTFDYILGPEVRSQDAKLLVADLLRNPGVHTLAWQLLKSRWDALQKKTGEFVGNTVIVGALSSFCDTRSLQDIRQFFSTHKVPDAERTLEQSLERVASCARLAEAQAPKLEAWLTANVR
jgi:puromycin-sensitive aminopeptidase